MTVQGSPATKSEVCAGLRYTQAMNNTRSQNSPFPVCRQAFLANALGSLALDIDSPWLKVPSAQAKNIPAPLSLPAAHIPSPGSYFQAA